MDLHYNNRDWFYRICLCRLYAQVLFERRYSRCNDNIQIIIIIIIIGILFTCLFRVATRFDSHLQFYFTCSHDCYWLLYTYSNKRPTSHNNYHETPHSWTSLPLEFLIKSVLNYHMLAIAQLFVCRWMWVWVWTLYIWKLRYTNCQASFWIVFMISKLRYT